MKISLSQILMHEFQSVADFLAWAEDYFSASDLHYGHGTDNPWDEAVMLVLHVLQLPADSDDSVLQQALSKEQQLQLYTLASSRVEQRIPVAYLTNTAWFAGERYYIDENAIIPRSPFAELISQNFQPWLGHRSPKSILDMCTGSGCIAIYCAKQFPDTEVDAVDISNAALEVARKNVLLHNSPINLIQSDLFSNVPPNKYDIIMSNPPYVCADEMAALPDEFRYEPELALASGSSGLDITESILRTAKKYLKPDGLLIIEVGSSWEALARKYPMLPFIWLEFQNGGEGVFLLKAEDL